MDAQNRIITATESDAEGVNTLSTPKMTKEEAQQKSDDELLQIILKAQGHTGKDFSEYMNCDFSYTYLTGLIRDSNLSKTFSLDINKEALLYEFERQNEIRLARAKAERDKQRAEQLDKYYAEVESAIQGNGTSGETVSSIEESDGRTRFASEERETSRPGTDTDTLIREIRADISDNRTQNRAVANTEIVPISDSLQR